MKVARSQEDYQQMLRDQHHLLVRAVEDFYANDLVQALNIARSLRTFIHRTGTNFPLLRNFDSDYLDKLIPDKKGPNPSTALMSLPVGVQIASDGTLTPVRPVFGELHSKLVPLRQWWENPYLIVPVERFSKKEIVLDLAETDGGVHVDPRLKAKYATIKFQSPLVAGAITNERGSSTTLAFGPGPSSKEGMQPVDVIRYVVGAAGYEFS